MWIRRAIARAIVAVATVAATPGLATAHSELISSDPAADTVLTSAPDQVVLTFDDELDVDLSTFVVTDAGGAEVGAGSVDLDVAERNVLRGDVSIDAAGTYEVSWSVIGVDGHEVLGGFSFVIGNAGVPNTAQVLRPSAPLMPLGAVVLVLALAVAAAGYRRARTR